MANGFEILIMEGVKAWQLNKAGLGKHNQIRLSEFCY
jgi:hypothetical protein